MNIPPTALPSPIFCSAHASGRPKTESVNWAHQPQLLGGMPKGAAPQLPDSLHLHQLTAELDRYCEGHHVPRAAGIEDADYLAMLVEHRATAVPLSGVGGELVGFLLVVIIDLSTAGD